MIKVELKPLPHRIAKTQCTPGELRNVIMRLIENQVALYGQLSVLVKAVQELQRSK